MTRALYKVVVTFDSPLEPIEFFFQVYDQASAVFDIYDEQEGVEAALYWSEPDWKPI